MPVLIGPASPRLQGDRNAREDHAASRAPLIGEVDGVEPTAITFEKSNGSLHPEVSGALSMSSDQLVGMDGQEPAAITNAPFGAVPQPVRQGTSKDVSYHGHWSADFTGTKSFITDFSTQADEGSGRG